MHLRRLSVLFACLLVTAACGKLGKKGDDDGGTSASSGGGVSGILGKALTLVSPTGEPFEGQITMNDTHETKTTSMVYEVKGDKLRFDEPSHNEYVIFNAPEKKIISVDDAKKTATVINLDDMQKMAGSMGAPGHTAPSTPSESEWETSIDMNAGSDVIAGYACDKWKVTETHKKTHKVRKTDACLAKGIGFPDLTAMYGGPSAANNTNTWMAKLVADKYFPLRAVTTEDGVEKTKMEVTKIDKKTLDAARFEVPAGYKVIDMGEMMKQLQNMKGMPH